MAGALIQGIQSLKYILYLKQPSVIILNNRPTTLMRVFLTFIMQPLKAIGIYGLLEQATLRMFLNRTFGIRSLVHTRFNYLHTVMPVVLIRLQNIFALKTVNTFMFLLHLLRMVIR